MSFIVDRPDRVLIPANLDPEKVKSFLTFRDKSIQFELKRLRDNRWMANRWGEEYYERRLEELRLSQNRCLWLEDSDGQPYTYSGLAHELSTFFGQPVVNRIQYPDPQSIPWAKQPEHQLRPYQVEMVEKLLETQHGAVSVGTGLGKTRVLLEVVKRLGLPALIVVPSVSIGSQILKLFKEAFGSRYVGMYGDGKKQFNKRFVIALAQSLTRLEPADSIYQAFAQKQVVVIDESHLLPSVTFEKVMIGICAAMPYRFSFSATQTRTDGAELLLKGLIGPIVYNMTVEEGVRQGYLARPVFQMVQVVSNARLESSDANAMDRTHLLMNPEVLSRAADIANFSASQGKPCLILIDEFEQAAALNRYLRYPVEFAHGGLRTLTPKEKAQQSRRQGSVREPKSFLPEKFWKSDVVDQVNRFNSGDFLILIGTSAIGLGTDILPVRTLIIIRKGTSSIKFAQSVGRGTRKVPGKEACLVVDFDVVNKDIVHRHAKARAAIYESICGPVKYLDMVKNG